MKSIYLPQCVLCLLALICVWHLRDSNLNTWVETKKCGGFSERTLHVYFVICPVYDGISLFKNHDRDANDGILESGIRWPEQVRSFHEREIKYKRWGARWRSVTEHELNTTKAQQQFTNDPNLGSVIAHFYCLTDTPRSETLYGYSWSIPLDKRALNSDSRRYLSP